MSERHEPQLRMQQGSLLVRCDSRPLTIPRCRDLKAENVLLRLDGTWVLADFGSASRSSGVIEGAAAIMRAEDDIRRATTPAYRAPEMWDLYSKEAVDYRVDLWVRGHSIPGQLTPGLVHGPGSDQSPGSLATTGPIGESCRQAAQPGCKDRSR